MAYKVYIYEDEGWETLLPLTHLHPVFDLSCGMWTPRKRAERIYGEVISTSRFHNNKNEKGLYINGRAIVHTKIPLEGEDEIFKSGGEIVAYRSGDGRIPENGREKNLIADIIKYPWDLIRFNKEIIKKDFEHGGFSGLCYIDDSAKIYEGVHLNTESGPIYIEKDVVICPPTVIYGPSYIGEGSIIDNAILREGCYIGRGCRIGGEIEESVFLSFVNKHHTGFIGHSYIGEWVNIGALTTTSDLKNTYRNISVQLPDGEIDTGLLKLGSIIGDHTKTGIGTLLTTGCIIGIFCNLYGGGTFSRYIESFSWGTFSELTLYRIDEAVDTVRKVMERRGVTATEEYLKRIRGVFNRVNQEQTRLKM
ncbi:hypothetical protein LR066_03990 [candidate division WOR-3 bacterium]|nr:hypothetical protein [candidate division WOR-3 bacterium]